MTSSRSTRSPGRSIFRLGLFAVFVALAPACAPDRPSAWTLAFNDPHEELLGGVRVWQVVSDDGWGSAIELSSGRFLTCRHVLPDSGGCVQLKAPGQDLGVSVQTVEGRHVFRMQNAPRRVVTIIAEGGGFKLGDQSTAAADWAVFTVNPAPSPTQDNTSPILDFGRKLSAGTTLYLVGYPFGRELALPPGPLVLAWPSVLLGRVWRPPPLYRVDAEQHVVMLKIVSDTKDRTGLSGGPALVWDSEARRHVVVGLCQGSLQRRILGLPAGNVPIVVRPPEALITELESPASPE